MTVKGREPGVIFERGGETDKRVSRAAVILGTSREEFCEQAILQALDELGVEREVTSRRDE